ncbi:Crp/Fnr family transcriptional regulator [Streptomyces sp. NPDC002476]|uniref:Crp/Fnr family transcriptional regulator n=1 Tax=Streptomyces sp. NPDC002476 TaxID=3364648 RepID=UPI00368EF9AC
MAPGEPAVEFRPRRSGSVGVRLEQYFQSKGVAAEAAAALAGSSTLFRHARETGPVDRNAVEIILSGVAFDEGRLWGPGRWLGDLDMFSGSVARSLTEFLCTTWTIRIPRDVLRSRAMRDLSVQRMLTQVLLDHLRVHDVVYGLDFRPTTARLAQLIHHLAHQDPDLVQARILPFMEEPMHGPTHRHLAHALGVSLASIEKSMRHLRKAGALASLGKGRAKRAYTILDPDLLHVVASGAVPAVAVEQ